MLFHNQKSYNRFNSCYNQTHLLFQATKWMIFQESKLAIIHEIENDITIFDKTKPTCFAGQKWFSFQK